MQSLFDKIIYYRRRYWPI